MRDPDDYQLTSSTHSVMSIVLALSFLLLSYFIHWLYKTEYVTTKTNQLLFLGCIFIAFFLDLLMGLHFKEFPAGGPVIKKFKYPKVYFARMMLSILTCMGASSFFVYVWLF